MVSALRGHDVAQAVKCLIVMVKVGKKRTRYVLAAVPGDARVDLEAVEALLGRTYAAFAGQGKTEELAGRWSERCCRSATTRDWSASPRRRDTGRTKSRQTPPLAVRGDPVSQQEYAIHYEPLFTTLQTMDIQALIDQVDEPWYNQTLIQIGDVLVRLGVMQGEFHWHTHDEQDEFFLVLDGLFRIELDGAATVELVPRQAFTVPAGMAHRPIVPVRSAVVMLEKAGVVATGD